MEEFWKGIDVPAKHSSERGLRKGLELTSQNRSDYQEQSRSDLKMEFLEISLDKIMDATNNFNDECCIGKGGFAHVYKAELDVLDIQSLPSNMEGMSKEQLPKIRKSVAIKKTKDRADDQGKQVFFTEIKLLTSCKHTNILSLLGFCSEKDELILVYELALNGSLADYLENMSIGKKVNLTWAQRIQICLDVAHGISYLHTSMDGKPMIIHRDIKSDNILLNGNLNAKVGDFGLSKFNLKQQAITMYTKSTAGTDYYMDPEYSNEFKYKREIDIYSFGVVLFEVMSGRLAYDSIYTREHRMGLAPIAKRRFKEGTLKQLIDPKLIEEVRNGIFTLNREHDQDPFDAFSKIAYQCLETQANRPTMEIIIKELQTQLNLQEFKSATNNFSTILSATNNFSDGNLLTKCALGKVYKGQFLWKGNSMNFTVRRLHCKYGQGDELQTEMSTLKILEQKVSISVLGHYDANDEKIIIYEQAFHGTLDQHLSDPNLTWSQRLRICLSVARALDCIHSDVIHCDINTSKIFLDEDWEPQIYGFELSTKYPQSWRHRLLYSRYFGTNNMTPKHDVYCFGVLLLEVLCGRKPMITNDGVQEELDDIIDPSLRKQMDTQLLTLFKDIAYKCLNQQLVKRPNMDRIVKELEEVLELQWKHENPEHSIAADKGASFHNLKRYGIGHREILSATNHFSDENLITKGALGKVYEGQLLQNENFMNFTVRRLNCTYGQGDELQKEISMLESFEDKNIISILGHYDKNNEKIIVYKHAYHGTLDQHLSKPTLTLSQRLKICLGVARGLNRVHYDVIHCDINCSKIFLDEYWEPKIYGFELSTKYPQSWRHRLLFSRYFNTSNIMTPKYDVYSFGVLLFEVFYGRKPTITEGVIQEEPDTHHNLMKQMEKRSLKKFKELVDKCLNQELVQRQTMDQTVKDLEEVLEIQLKRANLEHLKEVDEEATSYNILEIPLSEIRKATNEFHIDSHIGGGGFAEVYKAKLDFLNIQSSSSMEENTKDEPPKISKTVAIKKITNTQDENAKQGFLTELNLLSRYKHPNIVSLLGYSREAGEMILVYEYAFEGSLSDYMEKCTFNLTWEKRLQICLGVALGINHLHNNKDGKLRVIHRDIKSDNILLDENLNAKLGDFGLSKSHSMNQQASTMHTKMIAGTMLYMDPEYLATGRYKRESDIYSFGVVLFEVLSGKVTYDKIYTNENDLGLAPIARRRFIEGTVKELIDPKMIEEEDDHIFTLNRGPNQDSFHTFSKIAYQCLAETQSKRPTIEVVIKELQNALELQGKTMVLTRFVLKDIESATQNFAEKCYIGVDTVGMVYKAELDRLGHNSSLATGKNDNEPSKNLPRTVAIKRISNREGGHGKQEFFEELEMRTSYKHANIVSLLGFCDQDDEMIFVYEHVSERSLDHYLKSVDKADTFTWTHRLRMCLDVARGINHLHTKRVSPQMILSVDIKSANIMLDKNIMFDKNSGAKIGYFVISKLQPADQEIGMKVYEDPQYATTGKLNKESDIYSFGVVLFEIFCGRVAYDPVYIQENDKGLAPVARQCFKDGTIQRIIDPRLMEESGEGISAPNRGPNQDSLDTFLNIAYQCLGEAAKSRPTMEIVIQELDRAIKFHDPKRVEFR